MPSLAELRAQLATEDANLVEANEILDMMPENEEAIEIKEQVLARKKNIEDKIAQLSNTQTASTPSNLTTSTATKGTDSPAPKPHEEERRVYKVGENVTAKYTGDGQFYPATIVSVMGSSSAPVYTVRFKGYEGTETVRAHQIRVQAQSNPLKRKADDAPAVSSPAPTPAPASNGSVLSAPANINPELASQLRQDQNKSADDATAEKKPKKKNKVTQALEKQKSSWQDFQKKSVGSKVGKAVNKESMFRTGDNPLAKVGFSGSGKTMTKDVVKEKHKFQGMEEERAQERAQESSRRYDSYDRRNDGYGRRDDGYGGRRNW
ncbi:Splicing factor spf30 [Elsinoe australis]|uniref:Splicing factor spf30 n=1 Tax=Elsinoe australis TaxID=40998 RepID=A0A2P8A2N9_9PEZI|nr:Splicing factor spf30 [Elsinoe australis]